MSIEVVAFIFGAILLSTGFFGGGVSIKDITVPRIGIFPRVVSVGFGTLFIAIGLGISLGLLETTSHRPQSLLSQSSTSVEGPPVPETDPPPRGDASASGNAATPSNGPTEQDFQTQVTNQLIRVSDQLRASGYAPTNSPLLGQMEDNSHQSLNLDLRAGTAYEIVGVCDADCRDLDLHLYDSYGNAIDNDVAEDDMPIVNVTPQWDGPFTLNIDMASCRATYCYYGISVYAQTLY